MRVIIRIQFHPLGVEVGDYLVDIVGELFAHDGRHAVAGGAYYKFGGPPAAAEVICGEAGEIVRIQQGRAVVGGACRRDIRYVPVAA